MNFEIFPRVAGKLFEDAEIAVHRFHGGLKDISTKGTFFFAILDGRCSVNGHPLRAGMYGALPRIGQFEAVECVVMIADAKNYPGIFTLAGPIEPVGRLRYINGCTDTGLIQPAKLGDPCLNALFFPKGIVQTRHTHPSHRVGGLFDGDGECVTDQGVTVMGKGDIFLIPVDAPHHFVTRHHDMRIMVFHPDSEFGPTDEHHQMLDATIPVS